MEREEFIKIVNKRNKIKQEIEKLETELSSLNDVINDNYFEMCEITLRKMQPFFIKHNTNGYTNFIHCGKLLNIKRETYFSIVAVFEVIECFTNNLSSYCVNGSIYSNTQKYTIRIKTDYQLGSSIFLNDDYNIITQKEFYDSKKMVENDIEEYKTNIFMDIKYGDDIVYTFNSTIKKGKVFLIKKINPNCVLMFLNNGDSINILKNIYKKI